MEETPKSSEEKQMLSKKIKVDTNLILSNHLKSNIDHHYINNTNSVKEIVNSSIHQIDLKDPQEKLRILNKTVSYPNNYVFASLADGLYKLDEILFLNKDWKDLHGKVVRSDLGNWQLLSLAYSSPNLTSFDEDSKKGTQISVVGRSLIDEDRSNGYSGAAYWNPDAQQVIIAHSGYENTGGLLEDLCRVFSNEPIAQMNSAITFTDMIIRILKEVNQEKGTNIQLFITGYSLGAWLAQITAFSAKFLKKEGDYFVQNPDFENTGYFTSTVAFDGPGCEKMLKCIQRSVMNRHDLSFINSLDIINYLSSPNLINTCNPQAGKVYRLLVPLSEEAKDGLKCMKDKNFAGESMRNIIKKHLVMHTYITHKMQNIKDVFDPKTGEVLKDHGHLRIREVVDWPFLFPDDKKEVQSKLFQEIMWVLKTALLIESLTTKVILRELPVLGYVVDVQDSENGAFKKLNSNNKFIQKISDFLCSTSNPKESHFCLEADGRDIRYKTSLLDEDYTNKRSLNVFTASERRFLEEYKFLEKYHGDSQGIITLEELFDSFKGDKKAIGDMMEKLKGCTIENGIMHAKNLQEFIPWIKCMLHLFPEMKQKVTNTFYKFSRIANNEIYQLLSFSYLNTIKRSLDFGKDNFGLKDFFDDNNLQILLLNQSNTHMGSIRVYKTFNLVKTCYRDENSYAFINFDRIFYLGENIFIDFLKKISYEYLLVIECDNVLTDKIESFFETLLKTFQDNKNSNAKNLKLILITEKESKLSEFVIKYMRENKLECRIEKREVKWKNLTSDSRKGFLDKTVIFQGKELPLGKLTNGDNGIINPQTIIELFTNKKIQIGKPLPTLGEIENYYIDRKFIKRIKVKNEILQDANLTDMFAVSNISKEDFLKLVYGGRVRDFGERDSDESNPVRFIILNTNAEENDFNNLCLKHSNCTIHWLKRNKIGDLIWHRSHGKSLSGLRKYLDNDENDLSDDEYLEENDSIKTVDIDDISKFDETLIIIAAEPGMGKTTSLTRMGIREKDDSKWLIRINLVEFRDKLEQIDFSEKSSIVTFLWKTRIISSILEKKLLQSRLFLNGNVVFLLDGFDEISSVGQINVVNLIQKIRETKTEKIFITTRLHLKNSLENSLSTVAYTLKPFSIKDQKQFLMKIWQKKTVFLPSSINLNIYSDQVLKLISEYLRSKEKKFIQIPMQMRLIAEVFQEDTKNEKLSNYSEGFDILGLYDRFIDYKFISYIGQMGIGIIDLNNKLQKMLITSGIKNMLEKLAFRELFSEYDIKNFIFENPISEEEKQELHLVGIAQFIDDRIVFAHRSVGEYFAANFLADRLNLKKRNKQVYDTTLELLAKELFKKQYAEMKTFFDYRIAKEKVHVALLKGKITEIRQFLAMEKGVIYVTDILGRNALHYAAQEEEVEIVETLLENGAKTTPDLLGKTAFHYAARYNRETKVISCLLKKTKNCVNNKDHNGHAPVYYAAEQSNWDIVDKILTEKGASVDDLDKEKLLFHYSYTNNLQGMQNVVEDAKMDIAVLRDNHKNTLLHIAAQKGHLAIGEFLLEKEVDVNLSNNSGKRPIMYAAERESWDMVESLLRKNAKFSDISDGQKHVLFSYSTENAHWDIIKLFIEDTDKCNYYNGLNGLQRVELLFYLVISGDFDAAQFVIRTGTTVNSCDSKGKKPIHYASENKHWKLVRILLRNNANFNDLENAQKEFLLRDSVQNSEWDIVKLFVKDINRSNYIHYLSKQQQVELLCYFIDSGELDLVKFLIQKNAEINTCDNKGKKPIHYASCNKHWNIVELLFRKNANIHDLEAKEKDLLLSYSTENSNWSTVQLFMKNNNIDIYFNRLNEHQKVDFLCHVIRSGNFDMTKLIIERGVNPNESDSRNKKPIYYAASNKHWNIVELLLNFKANFNDLENTEKDFLFSYSVQSSNWNIVKLFLEVDRRFDYVDQLENQQRLNCLHYFVLTGDLSITKLLTERMLRDRYISSIDVFNGLLHLAAKNGKLEIVQYLVEEKRAFITDINDDGKTPKDLAIEGGFSNVVEFFEQRQKKLLLDAIGHGDLGTVKILINQGVAVDVKYDKNFTPLHFATRLGFVDLVQCLLENGADVTTKNDRNTVLHVAVISRNKEVIRPILDRIRNIPGNVNDYIDAKDSEGDTPLMNAAAEGKFNAAQLLLQSGARTEIRNNDGMTALHWAAQFDQLSVVKLLIDNGADIYAIDNIGRKSIHVAALHGHTNVFEVFLNGGVNIDETDRDGWTPLHYAASSIKEGTSSCYQFLLKCGADRSARGKYNTASIHLRMAIKELRSEGAWEKMMLISSPNSLLDYVKMDNEFADECLEELVNKEIIPDRQSLKESFDASRDLYTIGNYKEALKSFERVLSFQIRPDSLDPNHPDALVTRLHIAVVLSKLGKYYKSLYMLTEISEVQEKSHLGPYHPFILNCRHNIAELYYELGNYKKSLQIYEEVLEKREEILESSHPDTLITRQHIARVLNKQRKHERALRMFSEIFKLQCNILGADHPDSLSTQHNIAFTLYKLGKYKEAYEMILEVLEKSRKVLGDIHPDYLKVLYLRALLEIEFRDYETALQRLKNILHIQEDVLGLCHSDTLSTRYNIAIVLCHQGDNEKALNIFRDVYEKRKEVLGPVHPCTSCTLRVIRVIESILHSESS